ncbi:hypothetical protein SAMN04489716_8855 [Actinoplanes derwentensis]|uniref:Uncharacterized protein n=1 Tax=Actinoplanes derwentensis TaxID=113562 RepID=A0A1H2DA39_9ACTN|nr:hypothetical protein SAMN04489716_8855 [Actinoplanes derwentensis]
MPRTTGPSALTRTRTTRAHATGRTAAVTLTGAARTHPVAGTGTAWSHPGTRTRTHTVAWTRPSRAHAVSRPRAHRPTLAGVRSGHSPSGNGSAAHRPRRAVRSRSGNRRATQGTRECVRPLTGNRGTAHRPRRAVRPLAGDRRATHGTGRSVRAVAGMCPLRRAVRPHPGAARYSGSAHRPRRAVQALSRYRRTARRPRTVSSTRRRPGRSISGTGATTARSTTPLRTVGSTVGPGARTSGPIARTSRATPGHPGHIVVRAGPLMTRHRTGTTLRPRHPATRDRSGPAIPVGRTAVRSRPTVPRHHTGAAIRAVQTCGAVVSAPRAPSGSSPAGGDRTHGGRIRSIRPTSGHRRATPHRASARYLSSATGRTTVGTARSHPTRATRRNTARTTRAAGTVPGQADRTGGRHRTRAVRRHSARPVGRHSTVAGLTGHGSAGPHLLGGTVAGDGRCRSGPGHPGGVRPYPAVPSGVLLAVSREGSGGLHATRTIRSPRTIPTARTIRSGRSAAGSGLFRNRDTGAGGAVLAGLWRDSRSALDTPGSGALDDSGGTVGHGSGTTGDCGGTGTLPTRDHRRDNRRCSHRTPVTRADAARAGNVRRAGESADLRLVRVFTSTRVPATARLARRTRLSGLPVRSGPSVSGRLLVAATDHTVASGLAAGLYERVRTGLGASPGEGGVRAGTGGGPRSTVPARALVSRRVLVGPVAEVALRVRLPGPPMASGSLLGYAFFGTRPPLPSPARLFADRTRRRRRRAPIAPALVIPVRDRPRLVDLVIPARYRAGLVNLVIGVRDRPGLMDLVIATRNRPRLVHLVEATRNRPGLIDLVVTTRDGARLMYSVIGVRDRTGLVHLVEATRDGAGTVRRVRTTRDRVRGTETVSRGTGR